MLASCLNPSCNASFRYLYDGRIFTVERLVTSPDGQNAERMIEHYWLCEPCSMSLKVIVENGVAKTVPIHRQHKAASAAKAGRGLPAG
jgi:hypothetical protein